MLTKLPLKTKATADVPPQPGPTPFDGTYAGNIGVGTPIGHRARCTTVEPPRRLRVVNGDLMFSWNGPLTGFVTPDGNGTIVSGCCSFLVAFTKK